MHTLKTQITNNDKVQNQHYASKAAYYINKTRSIKKFYYSPNNTLI